MTAPTKTEPQKPITTNLTPPQSPIQKAVADAKAALAKSAADAAAQAGKGEDEKPPEPEVAPQIEEGQTQTQEPAEGEEAKPEEGEKPEGEEGKEEAPEAAASEIVVEIPGRRPGDEPMKIAVDSEETAERLRQTVKSGLRRDELNKAMEAVSRQREELDLVQQHLEIDPVGFLVEQVKPELQIGLAKHLLSIPEVFAAVSEELSEWQDDNVRARRQAELGKERSDNRRVAEREMSRLEDARKQGRMVRDTVEAIVPADMADEEAAMFRDDCLTDLANHVRAYYREHGREARLRPEDVVGILERRLRHHGLTPESALAGLSSGQPLRRGTATTPKKGPAPTIPDAQTALATGAKLKQASAARREAAAVPGAGAGARPAKIELPAQQGVKDRIAALRKVLVP
jgi:hypothetical protein